jgi:site-specific DNA recombinase
MIALYARVSTDKQAERFSLPTQLAAMHKHAGDRYPGVPTSEFVDAYSGETLERPKLDELRNLIRARAIKVVLAFDQDRLGRNLFELLILSRECDRYGVKLEFVTWNYEPTPTGTAFFQIKGVLAELERKTIMERTQRGKIEAAKRGRIFGGRPPFGYDHGNGVLIINEAQAAIIRRIFAMLLAHISVREIAAKLDAEGVLPQRGTRWRTSSLHTILRNKTYIGETAYNRRKRVADGGREVRPESEWIRLSVPAIIDVATFERAQAQLKRNSEVLSGRNDKRVYILRGLLRCGKCRNRIHGCASHGHAYYRCAGRDPQQSKGERCRAPCVLGQTIESVVVDSVREILKGGVLEQKVAEHAPRVEAVDYAAELANAQREIETWRRAEERAARFLVAPEHAERQALFEAELNRATKQRVLVEQRKAGLEQAQIAAAGLTHRGDAVRETCRRILRTLSRLSRVQWREVLRLLLDEITVTDRKLELRGILPADDVLQFRPHRTDGRAAGIGQNDAR